MTSLCRASSTSLPMRQVVIVEGPHPPAEVVTDAATLEPASSAPAVPPTCPKYRSAAVIHGQPRSGAHARRAVGSARPELAEGASQARG